MPALAALGTIIAGLIVGVILMLNDHLIIGVAIMLAAIPFGLAVWVKVGDRL